MYVPDVLEMSGVQIFDVTEAAAVQFPNVKQRSALVLSDVLKRYAEQLLVTSQSNHLYSCLT